ncbi:hypothetical protein B0H10DRAFT_1959610 [Mycena sp. CBHHK59/15]|nr:hypothetical protein B0H10DRAFT_1959610 [Mycena sp. CBHHK59/15]
MAEATARYPSSSAHIILTGCNTNATEKILSKFPKPQDMVDWKHEFMHCDATRMVDVRSTCAGLVARLSRVNFVVMSTGANSMVEASETSEGLDHHLSLRTFDTYYSRYIWTKELLPLVENVRALGQESRVMSVLGAGFGLRISTNNIGQDKVRQYHPALERSIQIFR